MNPKEMFYDDGLKCARQPAAYLICSIVRFQYFVSLSDVSRADWPKSTPADHILFKGKVVNGDRGGVFHFLISFQRTLKIPAH